MQKTFVYHRSRIASFGYTAASLNILLIKTTSLGDVLHNLPVVTDICQHLPETRIDWVVEENLVELPALHPGVNRVIPVAMRRWRKSWWASRYEIRTVCRLIRHGNYDLAVDTQGLLKSALLTRCAKTLRCGFNWNSAREPLASLFYKHTFSVSKNLHAVERNRLLAGLALGYVPQGTPDYGIISPKLDLPWLPAAPFVALLHATSRDDKLWPEENWIALGHRLRKAGLIAVLPWGNESEHLRAQRLAAEIPDACCSPRLNLPEATTLLGQAQAVVGVDTGLSHLAAALNAPTVGIYTATDPGLTGLYAGSRAVNLGGKGKLPSVETVIDQLAELGIYV